MALVPDDTVEHAPEGSPDSDDIWVIIPVDVATFELHNEEWIKERLGEAAYDMAALQIAQEQAEEEEEE